MALLYDEFGEFPDVGPAIYAEIDRSHRIVVWRPFKSTWRQKNFLPLIGLATDCSC
jgi:hypothetical protein